jgi:hypothetical protein
MKTEKELNQDILNMTMAIQEKFPELSKYIAEMPVKISYDENAEINNKNLKDYFNSLEALFNKYNKTHQVEL